MADTKKSFILYSDLIHTVKKMKPEDAGELFLHILKYVNDENPISENLIVDLCFEPIKQQLKRDLSKWDVSKNEKSLNGRIGNLKRWNIDVYDRLMRKEITFEEAEIIVKNRKASQGDKTVSPPIAKIAVNDNVSVTVNDNVSVISSTIVEGEKENFGDNKNLRTERCLNKEIKDAFFKNQDVEKIKKVSIEKDVNQDFANSLKFESPTWLDDVCIQQRKPPDKILEKIDEFVIFLKTHEKVHPSRKEFISHFINWVTKKFKDNGKQPIKVERNR